MTHTFSKGTRWGTDHESAFRMGIITGNNRTYMGTSLVQVKGRYDIMNQEGDSVLEGQ